MLDGDNHLAPEETYWRQGPLDPTITFLNRLFAIVPLLPLPPFIVYHADSALAAFGILLIQLQDYHRLKHRDLLVHPADVVHRLLHLLLSPSSIPPSKSRQTRPNPSASVQAIIHFFRSLTSQNEPVYILRGGQVEIRG